MTDAVTGDATRPQPAPVDLTGIDPHHTEKETPEQLIGTAVAETALGVTGVHHLGGTVARTLDRARRQVLGTSSAPGVTVATENGTTVIDLDLVVEYPHPVGDVVENVRTQVTHAARQLVDQPIAVNITVADVHGPFDQDPAVLDAIDRAGEKAREKAGDVKDKASELRQQADAKVAELKDQATDVKEQVGEKAGDLAAQASDAAEGLRARAADAKDAADDTVTEFAAAADAKVAAFQEKARESVDDAGDLASDAGDLASDATDQAGEKLAELGDKADATLEKLDTTADQKLDELDEQSHKKIAELKADAAADSRAGVDRPAGEDAR